MSQPENEPNELLEEEPVDEDLVLEEPEEDPDSGPGGPDYDGEIEIK